MFEFTILELFIVLAYTLSVGFFAGFAIYYFSDYKDKK